MPRIISNLQLYSQPVNSTSPTAPKLNWSGSSYNGTLILSNNIANENTAPDLVFTGWIDKDGTLGGTINNNFGILYTSITYPWIQYIDRLKLTYVATTNQ